MLEKQRKSESGNVLFLILAGCALLAALTFAMMGNKGGTQGGAAGERATASASNLVAYMQILKNGVGTMMLSNGCTESQLDFGTADWLTIGGAATTAANGSAPVNGSCSLFNAKGGGASAKTWDSLAAPSDYPSTPTGAPAAGSSVISTAKVYQTGSNSADVVYIVTGLKLDVCKALAKEAGIADPGTSNGLNDDCFTLGSGPSNYGYTPSGSDTIAETGTLAGHKLFTGTCTAGTANLPASATTCYAGIVLLER